eukprot:PITA_24893
MQEWPQPKTLKSLRGFLGLTGYYRKFVRNYGRIAKPLTQLLKKNSFFWNEEAQQAFTALKNAMSSTPVLALPDFTKSFVIECDASGTGIGAVLMQEGRPLAFTSQQLSGKNQGQSTYEKEMMAILHAVDTWRPYLLGRHFQIRRGHHSLKYFLEQCLSSPQQNKWLAKMSGYDYEIIYKKGKDNRVADALSRQFEEESTLLAISLPIPEWIEEARKEWLSHPGLSQLISQLQADPNSTKGYSWQDDILRYKDKVVISPTSTFKSHFLAELHSFPIARHSGFQKTYARARRSFFWTSMKKDILTFVTECDVCQHQKRETVNIPGTLQPLPIRASIWMEASMDFIIGLPKLGNKSVIMVVVDQLSRYSHFCALPHPFTPTLVAQSFMDQIFKLHGIPTSIVSDRDPIFTSNFWQELFRIQGTQLKLSTSYHLQIDGQTESINKCLETYLRRFTSEKQHLWVKWLRLAEWCGSTPTTPRNYARPSLRESSSSSEPHEVTVDQHRSECQFQEGDQVFLQLQPYKQTSLKDKGCQKHSPKFYGPYQVLQRIGELAYKLALPPTAKIHPVFHVSRLKKVIGNNCRIQTNLPELDEEGSIWLQPEQVLDTQVKQLRGRMIKEVLVKWKDTSPKDATWEPTTILQQFPQLQP